MAFMKRGAGASPSNRRKLVKAKVVLGLHPDEIPTPEQVNDGFRQQMRVAHPDNGGDPEIAAEAVRAIREARDLLLSEMEPAGGDLVACPRCKGTGGIRATAFGDRPCPSCGGAGVR